MQQKTYPNAPDKHIVAVLNVQCPHCVRLAQYLGKLEEAGGLPLPVWIVTSADIGTVSTLAGVNTSQVPVMVAVHNGAVVDQRTGCPSSPAELHKTLSGM
jgi:hypothetical protein